MQMRPLATAAIVLTLAAGEARAWIYPEHRDIAGEGVKDLDAAQRATLDRLWAEARKGHEARLCPTIFEETQGRHPTCLDWAAWPGIAGDHSCSGNQMLETVLSSRWILDVADVCADLKEGLATAKNRDQHRNRLTRSDLELQRADPEYGSRAGANNVHFLLARSSDDATRYLESCVLEKADLNAIGVYATYHLAALRLAAALGSGEVPDADRPATARAALAAEAFGLHFLEDSFAAGHVAGTWGDVSTRKGTHDYYNEHALDARFWGGGGGVIYGDAWMKREDLLRAGADASRSLAQFAKALDPSSKLASSVRPVPLDAARSTSAFDTCKSVTMPHPLPFPPDTAPEWAEVLSPTPVPGRIEGGGALPRFRSELGTFIGLYSSGRVAATSSGFTGEERSTIATGAIEVGARFGIGLEALLTSGGDGQIFVQAGLLSAAKQPAHCTGCPSDTFANLFPAVPARSAISTRLRLPFWLIPGDLLLAIPLFFIDPGAYAKMGIAAANGGLIPWQAGISTPLGRLQFILGREVGVNFFGYAGGEDEFLAQTGIDSSGIPILTPIALRSVEVDAPIVELRPFRDFATTQAASLVIQLGVALDIPTKVTLLYPTPGKEPPNLQPNWSFYFRIAFDWRRYL